MITGTVSDNRQDCFQISRSDEIVSFDALSANVGR
jgi:hypothetical protein